MRLRLCNTQLDELFAPVGSQTNLNSLCSCVLPCLLCQGYGLFVPNFMNIFDQLFSRSQTSAYVTITSYATHHSSFVCWETICVCLFILCPFQWRKYVLCAVGSVTLCSCDDHLCQALTALRFYLHTLA